MSRERVGQRGFTFIEITMVLFILSLFTVVAAPRFMAIVSDDSIDRYGSRLSMYIEHIRDEAVYKRRSLLLNCNLESGEFRVSTAGGERANEVMMRPFTLPENIKISDIVKVGEGKVFEGEVLIPFYPGGMAQGALIHLRGEKENKLTIEILALARQVKIHEGYIEKTL